LDDSLNVNIKERERGKAGGCTFKKDALVLHPRKKMMHNNSGENSGTGKRKEKSKERAAGNGGS